MVFAYVQPVQAAPPTTGLLVSAVRPSGDRWEQGFSYRPERCVEWDGVSSCAPHDKEWGLDQNDIVHYVPNGFAVADFCTTLDGLRDAERLARQVEAITSRVVAQELWTGAISTEFPGEVNGAAYVNPFLDNGDATAVPGTFATPEVALAALEGAALRAANGQQVFLHVPPEWPLVIDNLRRVGGLLLTPLDSVVVADAGYPAGNEAFATGPVAVRLSSIETVTEPDQTIDRTTNRQRIIGERLFAAVFDPCVHLSVAVTPAA